MEKVGVVYEKVLVEELLIVVIIIFVYMYVDKVGCVIESVVC